MSSENETIKLGVLYRDFEISRSTVDNDKRTVELSFSSEEPIERVFGIEILDHSHGSIRTKRLTKAGALLLDHDVTKQIGVVEKVSIGDDRKGRALVRFGKSALAEEVFQDVLDGIRKNVSVGYRIHQMVVEDDGKNTIYRAIDWEPMEISIVSIPADFTVGIGRNADFNEVKIIKNKEAKIMCEKCKNEPCSCHQHIAFDDERARAKKEELARVREIMAIAEKFDCHEIGRKHIAEGSSVDEFKSAVLEAKCKAVPIQTADLGMSNKEIRQYSIVRAIRSISETGQLDGLEKEASDATAKIIQRTPKGFFIPQDIMSRTLQSGVAGKGGYLVSSEVLATEMVELLRNKPLVARLGARTISGLVGNVAIPKVEGGATAYWLPETGEVPATSQSFAQLGLSPHRLVGDTAYTKELIMQSSIDVEAFVRNDLMTVLAIEKDRAAINGSGVSGQPLGILNTTGVKTVTFGGAPTWAKIVEFETQLAESNADIGSMAYLVSPAVRGKWKTTPKVPGQAIFLLEENLANGYPVEATNQVPNNRVIFANWADFIFAEWAGIDVVVDPYSLKKQGMIEVTVTLWADQCLRHPVSFCVSTDSGAQ